jgi:cellulose biosynthesis protein BcsQ
MKKIAFHIQKGGVGKTSLSGNIAYALSKTGNTVIVDCDAQGNLSSWFIEQSPNYELADVLIGDISVEEAIVKIRDNLYLIPTFSAGGDLTEFAKTRLVSKVKAFESLSKQLEQLGFDFAVYDLSPGMNLLEERIIASIDEVITPLTPEFFSLDGIQIFNRSLQKINEDYEVNIDHNKIVINNINYSFGRHKKIIKEMEKLDYQLFFVRQDAKVAESPAQHKSIFEYYPESKTIDEILKVSSAILESE